jgi:protein-tyrosine phosphatase
VRGFIDLHSHWVAGIDDGVRTAVEGRELLVALRAAGFDHVVATPHMRPGMFDNTRDDLVAAFEHTVAAVGAGADLPAVSLASEHFFDDVVFQRFLAGDVLPYPGGRAALVELGRGAFPARLQHRLHDLMRRGVRPVLAHPERYDPVIANIEVLDPLLDVGVVLLLDVAALSGKYGRSAKKTAIALLESGYYYAACSDAHKPRDVEDVRRGIDDLARRAGDDEARFLLAEGPAQILSGQVET